MTDESDHLTVKEYALLKRVTEETVRRWLRAGKIPGEQVGKHGHWRIPVRRSA